MPAAEADERGVVSLADAISQAPDGLPLDDCFDLANCIAFAMVKAAEVIPDVVHGDIKPDNILFLGGRPFLADFGLAGVSEARGRAGTPPYMAPELWTGAARMTPRSDIYAYGATLYEALTGRTPFEAPKDNYERWAQLHLSEPVPARPARSADEGELAQSLYELAVGCLAKDAASRPETFVAVLSSLFELGLMNEPGATLNFMQAATGLARMAKDQRHQTVGFRIQALLEQGEIESAVRILQQTSDDEITGDLLLTAGTTWSLAGDDHKALDYFDRFLATNPDDNDRARCLSERGLSLKRLGRLQEAKDLFEQLIAQAAGDAHRMRMARGNYAGVLLDLGEVDEARRELAWLVQRYPDSHEGQALYSQALERSGDLDTAVEAIQRAIALQPRNGNYHVLRAHLLLLLKRPEDAAHSVDAAYDLGHHSRRWLTVALATNLALGRTHDVETLEGIIREKLPRTEIEAITTEAMDYLLKLAVDTSNSGDTRKSLTSTDDPGDDDGGSNDVEPTAEEPMDSAESRADEIAAEAPPEASAEGSDESAEQYRRAIREGRASHFQIRMSMVDGSFAVDFYSDVESPEYVETFRKGYLDAKWRVETSFGDERQGRYRFARCRHCEFVVLTARDEGERFACQACQERGPVVTIHSDRLTALATECERAIGRVIDRQPRQGTKFLVAFWLDDMSKVEIVAQRLTEEGFVSAPPGVPAFLFFQREAINRNLDIEGPPTHLWHRPVTDADEAVQGQTPRRIDLLLRRLRREVGALKSSSMELTEDQAEFMLADSDRRLQMVREQVRHNPDDRDLKRVLVSAELSAGHLDQARRLATALEIAAPHESDTLMAVSEVALADGRPHDAVSRLERVVGAEPRNQTARILLIKAYQALNQPEDAVRHAREFEKLGGDLRRR